MSGTSEQVRSADRPLSQGGETSGFWGVASNQLGGEDDVVTCSVLPWVSIVCE